MARRRSVLLVSGVAALLLVLAAVACGGGDDSGAESGTGGTPAVTVDTGERGGDQGGDAGDDSGQGRAGNQEACAILTSDDVSEALGTEVTGQSEEDFPPFYTCTYEAGAQAVSLTYLREERQEVEAYFELGNEESDVIEGVGERAYWGSDRGELEVLQGDQYIALAVTVDGLDALEVARGLAVKVLERLQ